MKKLPRGVTLTSAERALVGTPTGAATEGATASAPTSYTCQVVLPNGQTCPVGYTRYHTHSHQFLFLSLGQHLLVTCCLTGVIAIEEKAQELAMQAFRQAQEDEQQRMRHKASVLGCKAGQRDTGPEMDAKAAERCAGKYAVCIKLASGCLLRIGPMFDQAGCALADRHSGKHDKALLLNGQQLVVGICNRPAQRWQEPQFLADTTPPPSTESPIEPEKEVPGDDPPLEAETPASTSPQSPETPARPKRARHGK